MVRPYSVVPFFGWQGVLKIKIRWSPPVMSVKDGQIMSFSFSFFKHAEGLLAPSTAGLIPVRRTKAVDIFALPRDSEVAPVHLSATSFSHLLGRLGTR